MSKFFVLFSIILQKKIIILKVQKLMVSKRQLETALDNILRLIVEEDTAMFIKNVTEQPKHVIRKLNRLLLFQLFFTSRGRGGFTHETRIPEADREQIVRIVSPMHPDPELPDAKANHAQSYPGAYPEPRPLLRGHPNGDP